MSEPLPVSSAVHALMQAEDQAAMRASLDLGSAALAAAEDFVSPDDARLSDARDPTAHTHAAGDITSGTLAAARLPAPGTSALGGVMRNAGSGGQFVNGIDTDGALLYGSPSGSGGANLDAMADATTVTITSDTGTDAVIPEAGTGGDAGVMSAADKAKLDTVAENADATDEAIDGAPTATTLNDTDKVPVTVSGTLKTIAYSALKTLLNALYAAKGAATSSGLTMSSARVLGRTTASAGAVEELTLSQLLDLVGSAANGDLLIRAGGAWTRLAKATDGNVLTLASGLPAWAAAGAGKILQVVQATKTDTASVTGTTFGSVLSGSITTSSASSKVLVLGMLSMGGQTNNQILVRLTRASGTLIQGDADGSHTRVTSSPGVPNPAAVYSQNMACLDSPGSAASHTYNVEMASNTTGTVYLNRSYTDTDSAAYARAASTLLLIEVAP